MSNFKKLSGLIFVILLTIVFIGCSDKSTDPNPDDTKKVPDNNIQNVNKEEVPEQSNGGDPRGTYFANSPVYFHFSSNSAITVRDSVVESKGKYMMKIEGSSATQGTYTYLLESYNIEQYIFLSTGSSSAKVDIKQSVSNSSASEEKGSWSVNGEVITFTPQGSNSYSHNFTANNRGIYYYSDLMLPLVGAYTRVKVYKKE